MNVRSCWMLGLLGVGSLLSGCDYAAKKRPALPTGVISGPLPSAPGRAAQGRSVVTAPDAEAPPEAVDAEVLKRREIILGSVVKLMRTAYINPGGRNFELATENLNDLFDQGFTDADFRLGQQATEYLKRKIGAMTGQDPEAPIKALQSRKFTGDRDARHIEDCMLYHGVATRVGGEGDDLTRVRRIFEWIVRNVQLVPAESLAAPGLRQAQARPADVLFRGMATESNGEWSERGWLFMSLCRQIGVDVGLLTIAPRRSMMSLPTDRPSAQLAWICAAIVDHKPYLFDQRIGMEVPGPDGKGVATLQEAAADPSILEQLDLPGQSVYGTTAADLLGSPTKIGILVDSSTGYFAPRMRLLQGQLRGEYRTTLFRDPFEQAANFAAALGPRFFGTTQLWRLPIQVEELLFTDPDFVKATQASLQFFDNRLPLLYARTAQLRGELAEATDRYVALRFAENPVMNGKDARPIAPEVQKALDLYATYFLAQCQLEQGNAAQAEDLFGKMLKMVPEPGPGRYYYYMLRWAAETNLGRLREAKGDKAGAIAYFTQADGTSQRHGNLVRARSLLWEDPLAEPAAPLPPAPPEAPASVKAAGRGARAIGSSNLPNRINM